MVIPTVLGTIALTVSRAPGEGFHSFCASVNDNQIYRHTPTEALRAALHKLVDAEAARIDEKLGLSSREHFNIYM